MDHQDLDEFIAENLHELAWHKNLPINEGIAGWCFLNGLKEAGFNVDFKESQFRIFYVFQHEGTSYELNTVLSRDEVMEGWKNHPRASPSSLYDSIYLAIDRMQTQIKGEYPNRNPVSLELSDALCEDRRKKAHGALKIMEKHFLEFFGKYQEGILTPVGKPSGRVHPPLILPMLIDSGKIDLDRINEGIRKYKFEEPENGLRVRFSSERSTISFLRDGKQLDEDYVVSESNAFDYIWASYLLRLAKMKGYPLKEYDLDETDFGMLEITCERGWMVLEELRR